MPGAFSSESYPPVAVGAKKREPPAHLARRNSVNPKSGEILIASSKRASTDLTQPKGVPASSRGDLFPPHPRRFDSQIGWRAWTPRRRLPPVSFPVADGGRFTPLIFLTPLRRRPEF